MSEANRQCVQNFLNAFYAGDIEGALACCSDDIDFIAHAPIDILPHLGHRHGKAEVGAMWKIVHTRYSNMRHELPALVAESDKVAAHIRVFFRKSSNDRVVQFDIADFATASSPTSTNCWIPSTSSSRCSNATSESTWRATGAPDLRRRRKQESTASGIEPIAPDQDQWRPQTASRPGIVRMTSAP